MAEYFDTEEVVKDYDRRITLRILAFLKPYPLLLVFALGALIFSTLGELMVPVLQQRLIDGAIIPRFLAIRTETLKALGPELRGPLENILASGKAFAAGEWLFFPRHGNQGNGKLLSATETELRKKSLGADLDDGEWYAFRFREGDPVAALVQSRGDIFVSREEPEGIFSAAIRNKNLYGLPRKDIAQVRAGDIRVIVRSFFFLLALLGLVFFFTFLQTWCTSLAGQKVMKDIRLALFQKTASQSTAFLSRHPVGRLVTRLTGDVETINEFFTSVLAAFLKDLSVMTGSLITLLALSPVLALITLGTLPPVLFITALSRVKARDAFRRQRVASSRVNSYFSEHLSGVQVVQLFRGEQKCSREFSERNDELLKATLGEMRVFAVFRPLVEWFGTLSTAVIIAVGSVLVFKVSLSLGVLIAFISLIGMFYAPVQDIAEKYTLLQSAMAGGERVFKLLDTEEKIPSLPAGRENRAPAAGAVRGHIEFENVYFSYKAGEEVLKGLSFKVNPGEMAAIVGYTGAGKTTIINTLTRLWDIDSGNISLDGIPIKNIPLDELRRACVPVLQDVFLFSGTLADNIRLGLPLGDGEVENAARAVHAHEFISRLPQGYQTILSEGASNISSGQRQLISFARVIAHNPAVVILDEATSSVDTETERLVQMGIKQVLAGRTSIVIAHRLSTIRHADRILVLQGGRLAEQGGHEELIQRNGLYAGLYKLQYSP